MQQADKKENQKWGNEKQLEPQSKTIVKQQRSDPASDWHHHEPLKSPSMKKFQKETLYRKIFQNRVANYSIRKASNRSNE